MTEKSIKNPAKWGQPWSEEDLGYLADNYGLTPNYKLAQHLQRSEISMLAIARHKLHIRETDNFYTASEVARTLGIRRIETIARWVRKGWLKSPIRHQRSSYRFTEEDVIKCLRQRPWLVDVRSMERHYFRSIIKEEWTKDRWYTVTQAAFLLRVSVNTIQNYINRGWISADGHNPDGKVNVHHIRHSSIEALLANDPRQSYRYNANSKAQKLRLRKEGRPTRTGMVWNFTCPRCGQEVRVMAPPDMAGPEVREKFIAIYVNGTCLHGAESSELRKLLTPREYDRFVELTIPG